MTNVEGVDFNGVTPKYANRTHVKDSRPHELERFLATGGISDALSSAPRTFTTCSICRGTTQRSCATGARIGATIYSTMGPSWRAQSAALALRQSLNRQEKR